jgi:hypothetical protein
MKRGLTTGQAKVAANASRDIAGMVMGRSYSAVMYDPYMRCMLMGKEVWTARRCQSSLSSGSPTCLTCWARPELRRVKDPKAAFLDRVVINITLEQIKMREAIMSGNNGNYRGTCSKCGRERTIVHVGREECSACCYGNFKDLTREEVLAALTSGKRQYNRKVPFPTQHKSEQPNMDGVMVVAFRSEDDKLLYSRILERARRNRREPGEELLTLAETSLDSGVSTDKVEVGKLRKIMERMQGYPVPVGSPKEVFAEAFNMMIARLDEMAGT